MSATWYNIGMEVGKELSLVHLTLPTQLQSYQARQLSKIQGPYGVRVSSIINEYKTPNFIVVQWSKPVQLVQRDENLFSKASSRASPKRITDLEWK